jgi:hypothetical protein
VKIWGHRNAFIHLWQLRAMVKTTTIPESPRDWRGGGGGGGGGGGVSDFCMEVGSNCPNPRPSGVGHLIKYSFFSTEITRIIVWI